MSWFGLVKGQKTVERLKATGMAFDDTFENLESE